MDVALRTTRSLLAALLSASLLAPAGAAASAPFPVSVAVTVQESTAADTLEVAVTSTAGAGCALTVAAPGVRIVRHFRLGYAGSRTLVLGAPAPAPTGTWTATATCRLAREWSRWRVLFEPGFANRGRALPDPLPSSGACNVQGVCFPVDPTAIDSVGTCTWYALGRRPDLIGLVHGDAAEWLASVAGKVPEGWFPVVGALAVWEPHVGGAGAEGHVGYVAAISRGRLLIQDANWSSTPSSPPREIHEHWVPVTSPSGFIYGGLAGSGP